jgi:mRNA interferase MazF
MVAIERGQIWWADLPAPRRSEPGYVRPVLVIQADSFNQSAIRTVLAATITSNLARAEAPGNVLFTKRASGLKRNSVVNVSQLITVDKEDLRDPAGKLPARVMARVDAGLRLVLTL